MPFSIIGFVIESCKFRFLRDEEDLRLYNRRALFLFDFRLRVR